MVTKMRPRAAVKRFSIIFRIDDMAYAVIPLQPDKEVARKAYRLKKQGDDGAVYDVHVNEHGTQCECLGFLRWQRPCKHIRTLQVAGMI